MNVDFGQLIAALLLAALFVNARRLPEITEQIERSLHRVTHHGAESDARPARHGS